MKQAANILNPRTAALIAAGIITIPACLPAEETQQNPVLTAVSATTLSGYVDTSASWMFGTGEKLYGRSYDQGSNSAPGQNKQDGFNLNVVDLTLEKPLEENGWSAGYRVQLFMGPDANALASSSSFTPTSDFAIKEANVALRAPVGNGLDFRLGVWTELLGYEISESYLNPNYSRSWGFFLEPIIHTGLLTSYKVNDAISASVGVVDNGVFSNAINSRGSTTESKKSYTGILTLTAPDSFGFIKGTTVNLSFLDTGASGRMDPINWYAGITMPTPIKNISIGVSDDYRANGLFDQSHENAADVYLLYQATEKLKLANRTEYATGSAGAWNVPVDGTHNVELLGETFTVDYSLWKNVVTRGELRWDHSLTGQGMFGDGTQRNAVSLTFDVVYKF